MTEEQVFERTDQQFREYLRNVGMHGTSNKKSLVLRVFLRTTKPVTVMELAYLVKKEDIGLSYHTVYQTMNRLVTCGLAIKIESRTEAQPEREPSFSPSRVDGARRVESRRKSAGLQLFPTVRPESAHLRP
jgi:predicted transcriptional regulator